MDGWTSADANGRVDVRGRETFGARSDFPVQGREMTPGDLPILKTVSYYVVLLAVFFMVAVAQLVRASGCGPEGRRFETGQSPQFSTPIVDSSAWGFVFFVRPARDRVISLWSQRYGGQCFPTQRHPTRGWAGKQL